MKVLPYASSLASLNTMWLSCAHNHDTRYAREQDTSTNAPSDCIGSPAELHRLLLPSSRVAPSAGEQDHASGQLRWSLTSMMPQANDELCVRAAKLQPPQLVRAMSNLVHGLKRSHRSYCPIL